VEGSKPSVVKLEEFDLLEILCIEIIVGEVVRVIFIHYWMLEMVYVKINVNRGLVVYIEGGPVHAAFVKSQSFSSFLLEVCRIAGILNWWSTRRDASSEMS
jgi:hypothetical protein